MTITDEQIGKRLWADLKAQAAGTAKLAGPGPNQTQLSPDQELLLFMKEADGWTPEKEMALLAEGKTRQEVGNEKYPHRLKLAASGDRALSKYAQIKYLADMARKADPTWAPTVPQGALPPAVGAPTPEAPAAIEGMVAPPDLSAIGG